MISLSPYIVKVYNLRTRHYENVHTGTCSLTSLFSSFITDITGNPDIDEDTKKAIKAGANTLAGDTIHGIFKVGEYGYESELHNTLNNNTSLRSTDEAELLPFYFHIKTHANSENALLLLQRFKNLGIRTILETYLQKHLDSLTDGETYQLRVEPVLYPEIINQYFQNSEIKRIKFIKNTYSDLADAYSNNRLHAFDAEFGIRIKRNKVFPQGVITSLINLFSEGNPTQYSTRINQIASVVDAPHVAYDNVKVELVENGKKRVIDLVNARKVRHNYDITADVVQAANGHPEIASIHTCASQIATEIAPMIWEEE